MSFKYKKKSLILFLILILILFSLTFFIRKYRENFEQSKKGLLVLYGESFRDGRQNDRTRDTENSINTQEKASKSHVTLCDYLKNTHNVNMDIVITTHDTKYKKELQNFYSKYNPNITTVDDTKDNLDAVSRITKNIQNVLLSKDIDAYDFILLTRNDICFKPNFEPIIDPEWNKIMFVSKLIANCKYYGFFQNGDPNVNPTIIYIPKSYFAKIKNNIFIDHDAWTKYKNALNITDSDMDFMTNYSFDSDTYKDKNDYYYMVGREENTIKHNTDPIDRNLIGKTPAEIEKIISTEEKQKCDDFKFDWKNEPHVKN